MDEVERAEGTMYGIAVGEALGRPAEGARPGAVKTAYGVLRDFQDPEKILPASKIYKWTMPGLYASGTQQAVALLDSVIQDRGFSPEKFAARLVALSVGAEYQFGVFRNPGRNFRMSVTELKQGMEWTATGKDSAGNAAAVRVAPLGVYFRDNTDKLTDAVVRASLLTHKNVIAISAAISVALFIAAAVNDDDMMNLDSSDLLEELSSRLATAENMMSDRYGIYLAEDWKKNIHFFSKTLKGLSDCVGGSRDSVSDWIAGNADIISGNKVTRPTLGVAPASVVFSIYLATVHRGDFEKALVDAVNSGGEAASVGAMTGAMSGAICGTSGIPDRWMKSLANRKQIRVRAESLSSGKWLKSKAEDLYEMEYGLTSREHEDRLSRMRKAGVEFPEKGKVDKMSTPEPISEKFDAKKYRREQERMKRLMKYTPPESWE